MSGGQIAALICAIILLLPGGCFLLFGIGFATDPHNSDVALVMLPVAIVLLSLTGLLFWAAFRRRPGRSAPPNASPPPDR
jgi:hypothetical protein